MMDSQDLYTYNALKVTTPQERELIKSIFTNPSVKEACRLKKGSATTREQDIKRGAVGCNFITSSTNSTPNLKLNGGQN